MDVNTEFMENLEDAENPQIAAVRKELRKLAEKDPNAIELDLGIKKIAKQHNLGIKVTHQEYSTIRALVEEEREPPPPPPSTPTSEEVAQREAAVLAKQRWDDAVNGRASEIAKSPDIVSVLQKTLHEHKGYIADYITTGTILVSHLARLLSKNSGFLFDGASGSGKSDLINKAAELLPPEDVILATSSSEQAIYYMGDLAGKYIVGGELRLLKLGEDDPWQQGIRQFISEGRISRWIPEKNENGSFVSVEKTANGPASIMLTTTAEATSFNDEFINRLSIAHTDDSESLTAEVLSEIAKNAEQLPDLEKGRKTTLEIEAWRQYHRGNQKLRVVIPFATKITPTSKAVTTRRLFHMICNYISSLALAHQASRKVDTDAGYMLASVDDYSIAYKLIMANAPKVSDTVNKRAREFYEKLKTTYSKNSDGFTQAQVQQDLKIPESQAYRFLLALRKAGCLSRSDEKKVRAYIYQIAAELPVSYDFELVHPDQLISSTLQSLQTTEEEMDCTPVQGFAASLQEFPGREGKQKNICIEF